MRPGELLFKDLDASNSRLEDLLRPYGGTIGEYWLETPEDQCWFPHRPGSIAEWLPPTGSWRDHRAILGLINWELTIEAMHPQLVFRWADDHEPWPAVTNPFDDPNSTNFTIDGLLYVRENASRLFDLIRDRAHLLREHGLVEQSDVLVNHLNELEGAFKEGGTGSLTSVRSLLGFDIDNVRNTITYRGVTYEGLPENAALFFERLLEADGNWITIDPCEFRADRLKKRLPNRLRELIQSKRGRGHRLLRPT
jgi:hypothetical protein